MSLIVNEIRVGTYLDSVALMRMGRELTSLPGIEDAGLMIGTAANREILRDAGVLSAEGSAASAGDLIIAIRASTATAAEAGLAKARALLDARRTSGSSDGGANWQPRALRTALERLPDANLALISVPGDFAAGEALKALQRGLNVMIFSDNVPLAQEVELKREARARGLLVMGPDCGTAIISGVPIAFANVVPKGDIGIIGASGTGIQEVSCLIAHAGRGVSHAIGTGGRDLKAEVGGITTLMAFDLLDADPATREIIVVSKPPAAEVADAVLARAGRSPKPVTVCFLGGNRRAMQGNVRAADTLAAAAAIAVGQAYPLPAASPPAALRSHLQVRGLFAGGTLCTEAQLVLAASGLKVASNVPIATATAYEGLALPGHHLLLDLGGDEYTRGRPHPMIEPAVRNAPLRDAAADPEVGVILLDLVLGFGAHADPAAQLVAFLATLPITPIMVASVTGTDGDPQGRARQVAKLRDAGIRIEASNAAAAHAAIEALRSLG